MPDVKTHSGQFEVRTRGKGTCEITGEVQELVDAAVVSEGTATVFVRHTSASLVVGVIS